MEKVLPPSHRVGESVSDEGHNPGYVQLSGSTPRITMAEQGLTVEFFLSFTDYFESPILAPPSWFGRLYSVLSIYDSLTGKPVIAVALVSLAG